MVSKLLKLSINSTLVYSGAKIWSLNLDISLSTQGNKNNIIKFFMTNFMAKSTILVAESTFT